MLNFMNFRKKLKRIFKGITGDGNNLSDSKKNNGVDLHAITIKAKHSNVAPSILP